MAQEPALGRVRRARAHRLLPCACALLLLAPAAPAAALPLSFSGPTHRSAGDDPRSVAIDDFDADGVPDLAVANEGVDSGADIGADGVSVLLGDGDGTFGGATLFAAGLRPRAVVVGLFNAGSDPDLVVANFADDDVSVLLGTGATAGSFGSPTDFAAGIGPRALATGFFNGDTNLDLAVANNYSGAAFGSASILLGTGTGTLGANNEFTAHGAPSSVAAGDFNGDGDPDLAVANLASDDVSVFTGATGGSFGTSVEYPAGNGPRAVVTGDFSGDGDLDLAVASENSDDVTVLLGAAGAGFQAAVSHAAGDSPRALVAADFTRDGDLDLATANAGSDNVTVLAGGVGASFAAPVGFPSGDNPFGIAADDFDGDGEQDIVTANFSSGDVSVLLNTTAPETTVDSGPTGATSDATPTFGFSADEPGATFECRVGAAAFAACAPPFTTAELPDGAHAFEVRARDPAGNADASPARRAFVSDTAVPDTRIDSGPGALTGDASPTFVFSSSEPGAAFQCRVDAAPFAACATPFTTAVLADGAHSFDVRAVDAAGNADPSPAGRGFTSDTAAPDTTIDSGPAGRTTDLTPSFGFSSTEPGSSFECRVDAAAFAACSAPFTTRARGRHAFEVRATDAAGNHDPSPARRSFRSLLRIRSKIGHVWAYSSRFTTVVRLLVKGVPTGARVKVRCSGRGCPFGRRTIRPDRRRRARATALFGGARLLPGTVVEVRVTAPEAIGRVGRFRIRSGAVPRLRELCLQPGNRKPSRCTA